jgi:hypothetical protein
VRPGEPTVDKRLFVVGEFGGRGRRAPPAANSSAAENWSTSAGIYLALPMPWWSSCSIRIVLSPETETAYAQPTFAGAAVMQPPIAEAVGVISQGRHQSQRVCGAAVVLRGDAATSQMLLGLDKRSDVAVGYLQGRSLDFEPSPKPPGRSREDQVLADISGVRGALVLLSTC